MELLSGQASHSCTLHLKALVSWALSLIVTYLLFWAAANPQGTWLFTRQDPMKPKYMLVSDGEVVQLLHLESDPHRALRENEGLCCPVEYCVQNSN